MSYSTFVRSLNIISTTNEPFELLIFCQPNPGNHTLYHDLFPVAWRVIPFGDSAKHSVDFIFSLEAFVGEKDGNRVNAKESKCIDDGQSISVVAGNGDAPTLGFPTGFPESGEGITIKNNSGTTQNVGLMIADREAVVCENVASENQVVLQVEKKVYLAINQPYCESEIIRTKINAEDVFSFNLAYTMSNSVNIVVGKSDNTWSVTMR